ncbi:MAG: type II toxin-antitoxin system PemK/MazF family toxin [Zetaproteobacteria bacterium CG_4_9_14_3_um_filter_49_83]|nr:MAG: hypothetical protein COW62_05370 [Zetaproteobacteria bacterium CG17_big_fil_post_rev_8_21_14_2_50_50_13]PIV29340.1 MAG: type II toxin-antitoxin system PemK/MazF family toxin [Zetaproteobacteria bacterium CG02_land_8_20_14_3_00_50_9]PIY55698.1 MAG: type II toxin-antitoxin system PemK/MazF family toxin [Zetaproteobacteria bacterium CG_4_10_14_0_8_um_filter_49_80]PJA36050.1 MAG: type II toxin-antitoxin system PemK/MazF family toxin [Zetaproteobacteria bacterium CG_4_9_14_3_um_filter_49_83]
MVVCPITSHHVDAPLFRLLLSADDGTGLNKPSQIMVDKLTAIKADRIRERIGSQMPVQGVALDTALKLWLGL